jgi:hypothetical protein
MPSRNFREWRLLLPELLARIAFTASTTKLGTRPDHGQQMRLQLHSPRPSTGTSGMSRSTDGAKRRSAPTGRSFQLKSPGSPDAPGLPLKRPHLGEIRGHGRSEQQVILLPRKQKAPHTKRGQVVSATNRGNASSLPPSRVKVNSAKSVSTVCEGPASENLHRTELPRCKKTASSRRASHQD